MPLRNQFHLIFRRLKYVSHNTGFDRMDVWIVSCLGFSTRLHEERKKYKREKKKRKTVTNAKPIPSMKEEQQGHFAGDANIK